MRELLYIYIFLLLNITRMTGIVIFSKCNFFFFKFDSSQSIFLTNFIFSEK